MPDHREVSWDDIGQGVKNVIPLCKDQTVEKAQSLKCLWTGGPKFSPQNHHVTSNVGWQLDYIWNHLKLKHLGMPLGIFLIAIGVRTYSSRIPIQTEDQNPSRTHLGLQHHTDTAATSSLLFDLSIGRASLLECMEHSLEAPSISHNMYTHNTVYTDRHGRVL